VPVVEIADLVAARSVVDDEVVIGAVQQLGRLAQCFAQD